MKFAVAICIIGFVPTMAFGFGKKHFRLPQLDKPTAPVAHLEECTDFSGTWKGTCTYKADNDPAEVTNEVTTITQDRCYSIDTDDATFIFGGAHTETDTNSDFTVSVTRMADWNKDKTGFFLDLNANGRVLSKGDPSKIMATGSGTVKLVDGKLVSSLKVKQLNLGSGTQKTYTYSNDCIYEKQ